MITLDELDRKILAQVQRNASIPLEDLGQKVGLSRNACWRRLKSLEENGVITGRVALLDGAKIGLSLMVFMSVRTDQHDPKWLENFATATRAMPEILSVFRMTGDLDYLIRARVADMAGYDALYQRLIRRVPMSDVSASFVMEEIKDTTQLPL